MPHRLQFTCPLSAGLHARPASRLAEIARGFAATCQLTNIRSGARADAKSVLAILAADIGAGDACDLEVSGGDEQVAAVEMEHFLRAELSAYEEEDPPPVETETTLFLPLALARSGARWWRGRAVSPGVGLGRVFTPVAAAGVAPARTEGPGPDDVGGDGAMNGQGRRRAANTGRWSVPGRG